MGRLGHPKHGLGSQVGVVDAPSSGEVIGLGVKSTSVCRLELNIVRPRSSPQHLRMSVFLTPNEV